MEYFYKTVRYIRGKTDFFWNSLDSFVPYNTLEKKRVIRRDKRYNESRDKTKA